MLYKAEKGNYCAYAVYSKDMFIGIFYMYDMKWKYKRANIAFAIIPRKRGHILSLPRINRMLQILFEYGLNRIVFEIEDENTESLKVAKHLLKIGFEFEGKLRDNYGIGVHSNVYSLLKNEYV